VLEKELDDPERDPEIRTFDRQIIHPKRKRVKKGNFSLTLKGKH